MNRMLVCAALALSLGACVSRPVVSTPEVRCNGLIPDSWSEGVPGAAIPQNDPRLQDWIGQVLTEPMAAAIIAPWAAGYVAQDGQLDKANGRTQDAISIDRECEAMVNAARLDRQ